VTRRQKTGRKIAILCPVDFSAHSAHALRHAIRAAARFDGRVTVLFVNEPLLLAAGTRLMGGGIRFVERTRAELVRFVKRSSARVASRFEEPACVVTTGDPADGILLTARQRQTDLIVIGTHGLGGVAKLFFGSTTDQILGRTTVPVLAIPPARHARESEKPFQRVVVPLDLVGAYRSDAVRAERVAAAFGAQLVLLHVVKPVQSPAWLQVETVAGTRREVERAHAVLERLRGRLHSHCDVVSVVLEGNPAPQIAQFASAQPSLVVMSLRGGAGLWGARRGSIACRVLGSSGSPVLALPRRRLGGAFSARLRRAVASALSTRDRIEMAGVDALLSAASIRKRA
jgi:nucleotide-binding universal stress UspA family protein